MAIFSYPPSEVTPQYFSELVMDDSVAIPTTTAANGVVLGSSAELKVSQQAIADMSVRIQTAGTCYNHLGRRAGVDPVVTIAIAASDPVNPRIDVIVIDSSGIANARTGTPAGSPVNPTLTSGDVPLATVAVAALAVTIVDANITDVRSRDSVQGKKILPGTIQTTVGTDVASANSMTLSSPGQVFNITGATQLNAITTSGFDKGNQVVLVFGSNPLVKHNTAGGGGTVPLLLAGSADLSAATNTILGLIFLGNFWQETFRKTA